MKARLLIIAFTVLAVSGAGSAAGASPNRSLLLLEQGGRLGFDVLLDPSTPTASMISITAPLGYELADDGTGGDLGSATVEDSGGVLQGTVSATDEPLPDSVPCLPGPHHAVWQAFVSGEGDAFTLPIAVDRIPLYGFRLTFCLDALHAKGRSPEILALILDEGVVKTPVATGTYVWSALVTRFDASGAPDPATTFELRADELVPHTLSARASFSTRTRVLTVRGTLSGSGERLGGERVDLFASAQRDDLASPRAKHLGTSDTNGDGGFTFRKRYARTAKPPAFVLAVAFTLLVQPCRGPPPEPSIAPAGCVSETVDQATAPPAKVVRTRR